MIYRAIGINTGGQRWMFQYPGLTGWGYLPHTKEQQLFLMQNLNEYEDKEFLGYVVEWMGYSF